ncbi:MAG: hypothetical protein PHR61_02560 [Candidatus Absconditabacteria bacterium]|nr:hypothetical protein [Candidatus Absconditabacteria bacterium]
MTNKLKSAMHKAGLGASVLAGFLLTSKDALAQNIASNDKNKAQTENTDGVTNNANSLAYTDPLAFTQQNIQNYFPDQESINQANFLINRLGKGTIRNQVNQLIIESIVNNISDPKQQIRTIIFALERYVFGGDRDVTNIFSKNNQSREAANFKASMKFGKAFMDRYKSNLDQMIKDIEQGKKDIEQGKKDIEQGKKDIEQGRERLEKNRLEIENTMQFITPDMVKSDPNIRNIIIRRQQRYKNLGQTPTNPHIISLFDALK